MSETRNALDEMGKKILGASRTELYLSMHFMGAALNSLDYIMDLSTTHLGTDAAYIRFNPNYLLRLYIESPRTINRAYMHMLMHCLFRHMFYAKEYPDTDLWNLCCDIAVESVIDTMDYPAIDDIVTDRRQEIYDNLKEKVKVLTAQRLYRYFDTHKRDYAREQALAAEFYQDDHSFWQKLDDEENNPENPLPPPQKSADDSPDGKDADPESKMPLPPRDTKSVRGRDEQWKKNARRVKAEIENAGKEASKDSGSLERILSFSYRKRTDYREFLKRFMLIREETGVDPDSFDYGYYSYGMQLYGNMPLIEENEFREAKKISELVIAIDTSASCQKTLVQKFLNTTADMLFSENTFFQRVRIHIIECDDQIQNDLVITDVDEMRKYADAFSVKGGFGTDFRPVFAYVERLRKKGELRDLKGLLYFTDGMGVYPKKATSYETAFVFTRDEELDDTKVPDWALKLYI